MYFHRSDCNFANLGSCILGKKLTCKPCFDYVKTVPNLDRSGHVTILLARKAGRHSLSSMYISFFSFVLALSAFLLSAGIISLPKQATKDSLKADTLLEAVRNNSELLSRLRGPQGPAGPKGIRGAPGPQGLPGKVIKVEATAENAGGTKTDDDDLTQILDGTQ